MEPCVQHQEEADFLKTMALFLSLNIAAVKSHPW